MMTKVNKNLIPLGRVQQPLLHEQAGGVCQDQLQWGEEIRRHWVGGSLAGKSAAKVAKLEKSKVKKVAKKLK